MRRTRPLTIEIHAALELALAAALILLPYAIGLPPASILAGVAIGGLVAGLALAGSDPRSRGGLPLSAHATYDWAAATGLICAGIVLGLAAGPASLIVFLAAGIAEFTLAASTSYRVTRA